MTLPDPRSGDEPSPQKHQARPGPARIFARSGGNSGSLDIIIAVGAGLLGKFDPPDGRDLPCDQSASRPPAGSCRRPRRCTAPSPWNGGEPEPADHKLDTRRLFDLSSVVRTARPRRAPA